MKKKMKKNTKKYITIYVILVSLLLWTTITTVIVRFKNPELTETELFLRIPKSFILNFE